MRNLVLSILGWSLMTGLISIQSYGFTEKQQRMEKKTIKIANEWPQYGLELVKVVKNAANTVGCPVVGTDLISQISHGPWIGQVYGGQSVFYNPKNAELIVGKDREREIVLISIELNK